MLWNDLRYTARMLRTSPLFTIAVVLTVALAIGANTAIFSVVNAVMVRPLPFDHPDRLVWIAEKNDTLNLPQFSASVLNFLSWKERSHPFESMGAFGFATFRPESPRAVRAAVAGLHEDDYPALTSAAGPLADALTSGDEFAAGLDGLLDGLAERAGLSRA